MFAQCSNICEGKTQHERLMTTDSRKRHLEDFEQIRSEDNTHDIEHL
jgi:hypothetical protein